MALEKKKFFLKIFPGLKLQQSISESVMYGN